MKERQRQQRGLLWKYLHRIQYRRSWGSRCILRMSGEDFMLMLKNFEEFLCSRAFVSPILVRKAFKYAMQAYARKCLAESLALGRKHWTTFEETTNNDNAEHLRSTILILMKFDSTTPNIAWRHSTSPYKVAKRFRCLTRHKCRALSSEKSRGFGRCLNAFER